jgi:signal transduction histidine kinase/CheY-like chemotaxis protein
MSSKIIANYAAEDLLGIQSAAIAITDAQHKVIWYNQKFKQEAGTSRLKGVSVISLFNLNESIKKGLNELKNPLDYSIPNSERKLIFSPLYSKKAKTKLVGFLVEINSVRSVLSKVQTEMETSGVGSSFQTVLQEVLVLLAKENSIEIITEEILSRIVESSKSGFGVVAFHNDNGKFDFYFFDPGNFIGNKDGVSKVLRSDFAFISKWLELNHRPLISSNNRTSIGYNLTQSLGCNSLLILPAFFDKSLIASILLGKKSGDFNDSEKGPLEQFATLLSYSISSIRTRQLNTALENRLLQAQKLETIGKLSSGMAHDFSNLLSSIFGSINLLRKRVEPEEGIDKLIDNIENCSIRAKDLTKGLLSFGKPTPKRKELVKPNQLLGEISKVITQTFPAAINFNREVDDKLYDILGNGTEIYQVLLNLCVNAKEATNEKGMIKLNAKNITIDKENQINHPLLPEGNYVCFSVQDNGSGIKEGDLQKIFDPYFSTKNKDTGSGLGLYVTYGIIKAHNGYIDVSSKENIGTTFEVFIPAYEPLKARKQQDTGKIILLADDEPMLSELLSELLESSGYNVIKVSSGDEAIRLLTEEIKVDLAIIDYNMPGKTGLDTIAEIRNLKFDMPIILSSGSMRMDEEPNLESYKINSRLQKPYEFETMLATIQKFI